MTCLPVRLVIVALAGKLAAVQPEPLPIIFDTDIVGDVDDMGAVVALHALANQGEATNLAMGVCVKNPWCPLCLDALNTYLIKAINGRDDVAPMPPRRALPPAVIEDSTEWITWGAPDPRDANENPTEGSSTAKDRGDREDAARVNQRPDGSGPGQTRPGAFRPGRMGPGGFGRGSLQPGGMREGETRPGSRIPMGFGPGGRGRGPMGFGGSGQGRRAEPGILDDIYALDLTETQGNRLRQLQQEASSKLQEFIEQELPTGFGAGRGIAIDATREKLLLQAYDKASEMLTPAQKTRLQELNRKSLATENRVRSERINLKLLDRLAVSIPPENGSGNNPFEDSVGLDAGNFIDTDVENLLRENGILPAPRCSDEVFIRRVYLDVIGVLPTAREVVDFLENDAPGKRTQLIDALLDRSEYSDYQAMKWCDVLRVKAEFPINLWPNGAAVYHRWIRDAIRTNMPYDEFVRALLTTSGSSFRNPPVNFYRATRNRDPDAFAGAVALTFMGLRNTHWTQKRRREMAVFFSQLEFKETQEWKEEIVCWNWKPLATSEVVFPDGKTALAPADKDPRQVFADWLVRPENPWFAKSVVNRIWFWLFGRGIIHEPDDIREDNPPSNPALLAHLADEFCRARYDLKHIYRLILTSHTYQRSSIPKTADPKAEAFFAHYPMRQLDAEVLQDALCQILNVEVGYQSDIPEPFAYIPPKQSTVSLADGSISSPFLKTFGRPSTDNGFESDRQNDVNESHRLFFINSTELNGWIQGSWLLRKLPLATGTLDIASLRWLWLSILSRYPTSAELESVKTFYQSKPNREIEATQDLVWALINTKEFSCRH